MAFYRNGTATFTNGSTAVVGLGTNWDSSMIGSAIQADDYDIPYEITAVPSATSVTLSVIYGGTSGSGKNYRIGRAEFDAEVLQKIKVLLTNIDALIATDGVDHTLLLDKLATANEATHYFAVGASKRARAGIIGNNKYVIEVSSDGTVWKQCLHIDEATGKVTFAYAGGVEITGLLTASAGVKIGGSGSNNLLSVFDAGTWTPALQFGGSTAGITYAAQTGYYIRIGSFLLELFSVVLTSNGTATGSAEMTGQAFTLGKQLYPGQMIATGGVANLATPLFRAASGPKYQFYNQIAAGVSALNETHITDSANMKGSIQSYI